MKRQFDDMIEDEKMVDLYKTFVVEIYDTVIGGIVNSM